MYTHYKEDFLHVHRKKAWVGWVSITCFELQWSVLPPAARNRRRETSSSYQSNLRPLFGSPSLDLSEVSPSFFWQGSMIFAKLSGMQIMEIGCVPTVIRSEMNPNSINSAYQSTTMNKLLLPALTFACFNVVCWTNSFMYHIYHVIVLGN